MSQGSIGQLFGPHTAKSRKGLLSLLRSHPEGPALVQRREDEINRTRWKGTIQPFHLGHVPDDVRINLRRPMTKDGDSPFIRLQKPEKNPNQRRLPSAIWSHYRHEVPGLSLKGNTLQDGMPAKLQLKIGNGNRGNRVRH